MKKKEVLGNHVFSNFFSCSFNFDKTFPATLEGLVAMERMSIKYFVNNNSLGPDRNISSVGFEEIPPNTSYPTLNHSAGYYFNPDKGRMMGVYNLFDN